MKKLVLILACIFAVSFVATDLQARAIGVKGGWATMQDAYKDANIEDTWTLGVFFDMGSFVFNSLKFRPGLDYIKLEDKDGRWERDVWGLHLDWYWNFMESGSLSPFLGFGAALNYYDGDSDNRSGDDDSDAGAEVFLGTDISLSGILLVIEGRYCFNDIANRDQNIAKLLVGALFKF